LSPAAELAASARISSSDHILASALSRSTSASAATANANRRSGAVDEPDRVRRGEPLPGAAFAHRCEAIAFCAAGFGSSSQNVEPRGSFGSTPTSPPMLSTRCFTIDSPSPVPPASRERLGSAR
jgi:hypothetical protein